MSQQLSNDCFDSPVNFASNLHKDLPFLLSSVENNLASSYLSQALKFLFGQESVINNVIRQDLETNLLKPTLNCLRKLFSSRLLKTFNILENAEDSDDEVCYTLNDLLQGCLNILDGYNDVLVYSMNVALLESKEVESLISTLPHVLLEAFNYCRGSENVYGSYFSLSTNLLTSFFRKSYEITSLFYKILDEHVTFDCSCEKTISLLITALETLCEVGEVVVSLDMKSLVDQWRGIYKLITKYSNNLKDRFNISQPLTFLSSYLNKTILSICNVKEQENEQTRIRNLKLGSFILKIIVKLTELYFGYLGSCMTILIDLLLHLNRCSRLSRNFYNEELERFIVVGAGPLLSNLIQDCQFIEEFRNCCDSLDSKPIENLVGLFYTHLRLLKFLINYNNSEVCEVWLGVPLVSNVIALYKRCCKHLDLTVSIEEINTYTVLVSVTVAYVISNFTNENFISLENILLSKLFKADIEVAILVSDLLTLFCRLTNEEICIKYTKYIFYALILNGPNSCRPQVSIARVTAGRLYSILSKTGQEAVENQFSSHPYLWRHVQFSSAVKLTMATPYLQINHTSTPLEFINLVECLNLVCSYDTSLIVSEGEIIEMIKNVLICLKIYSETSKHLADWWYNSFYLLVNCISSAPQWVDSINFNEMLDIFQELLFMGQPPIMYYITKVVAKVLNTSLLNENCQLNKVMNIFQMCLTCNNILVKQITTENWLSIKSFKSRYVSLDLDEETKSFIENFNKNKISDHNSNLFSFDIHFLHKCIVIDGNEVEESPPNKKIKKDIELSNIAEVIFNLKSSVENVVVYANNNVLSIEEKELLKILKSNLEKL